MPAGRVLAESPRRLAFGLQLSAGGRYDNVRKCVASSAGSPGGPAADISVFGEVGLGGSTSLIFNLPVMRPVLFGLAFRMLQFEPDVTLAFRKASSARLDWVIGPTLGITLHYGADYHSEGTGDDAGPTFFALGPTIGAYLGMDFKRPERATNFQIGIHPYVTPLFAISDPGEHRGIVVGGLLVGQLRWNR
jgi:hypothetical protein